MTRKIKPWVVKITYTTLLAASILASVFTYNYRASVKNTDKLYYDIKLKITSFNSDCSLSSDKFHKPQLCNTILFETLSGPKLYMQINTCAKSQNIYIDTKWLYNHQVGDTVHFDYLLKDKFFTINKGKF